MKSVTRVRPSLNQLKGKGDQTISADLRIEGDLFYEKGKFFEAHECYNKSLCAAQLNSRKILPYDIDFALAYERRSVVYYEVKEYKLCLDNIQWAFAHAYNDDITADLIENLNKREKQCRKLMETHQPCESSDPWNFFKLSYPANEKIPFIVNCVELHNNKSFGRFIITTRDLKPGEIIAIEEPFFKTIKYESAHTRCINCLKSNKLSLIPSHNINEAAMYCSEECMEATTKTFLHVRSGSKMYDIKQRMLFEALAICDGSFDKLKQLMDSTDLLQKTIFDFDLSDPNDTLYKYKLLTSIISLSQITSVSDEVVRYLAHHSVLDSIENENDREVAKIFLLRAFRTLTVNSFGIEWVVPATLQDNNKDTIVTNLAGDALCLFGSLLNHSCSPNIDRVFVDNKFVFFVRRPILKGQQLFTCYGTLFLDAPREMRQETLRAEYGFLCCCEACEGDYPTPAIYPWTDVPLVISDFSSVDDWKKDFERNCLKIVKKQNKLSHSEMCIIMLRNLYYLVAIARTEPFIF